MSVFLNNSKFNEYKFESENEFENEIVKSSQAMFGDNTIYIDAKKKIETESLGGAIPDGFLFDLTDKNNPAFYLVEIELAKHSFYNHIFPQITKFFAFFKNQKMQKSLVEKLFSIINNDKFLKNKFKKFLGDAEVFKFINDVIESNPNILLIIDGDKKELPEIMDTYSDTWGKLVRHLVLKKYIKGKESIYVLSPDFETIEYFPEGGDGGTEEPGKYSETYHLEGCSDAIKDVYKKLKEKFHKYDDTLIFNPQKYYISIKSGINTSFIQLRKKKINFIVMRPEKEIKKEIKHHHVKSLSEGVQNFYGAPCAIIFIEDSKYMNELVNVLKPLIDNEWI